LKLIECAKEEVGDMIEFPSTGCGSSVRSVTALVAYRPMAHIDYDVSMNSRA